jgi:hypothetical protein
MPLNRLTKSKYSGMSGDELNSEFVVDMTLLRDSKSHFRFEQGGDKEGIGEDAAAQRADRGGKI